MTEITREEIDAKLETKATGLAGQIELMRHDMNHRIDLLTQEMRTEFRHQREDMNAMRSEMQNMKFTILVALAGSVLAVIAIIYASQANMLSAFQAGLAAVK